MGAGAITFEVHRALGGGGMADVFLATMRDGARASTVALKRMRPNLKSDPGYRAHFEREARIGELLRHRNVVTLERFGEDEQGPWLALEYVDGASAARLMQAGPGHSGALPLEVALALLADVTDGLAYAHGEGIVHRDLSPDNVLVSFAGVAKLADFGIARPAEATRLTTTGTVRGKVSYLAPEQFDGAESSLATDRYALGVLAFVLLSGVSPFGAASEAELIKRVLSVEPPRLDGLRPDVPAAVADWVEQVLQKAPAARPGSLEPLQRALAELAGPPEARQAVLARFMAPWAAELGTEVSAHQQVTDKAPRRRSVALPLVAGLAALAVAALAAWSFWPAAPGPAAEPVALAAAVVDAGAAAAGEPGGVDAGVAEAQAVDAGAEDERPEGVVSRAGTLWIRVRPWAQVLVDGKDHGQTPLAPLKLAAGKHTVLLVNPSLKVRKSYTVRVVAGRRAELKVVLDE